MLYVVPPKPETCVICLLCLVTVVAPSDKMYAARLIAATTCNNPVHSAKCGKHNGNKAFKAN